MAHLVRYVHVLCISLCVVILTEAIIDTKEVSSADDGEDDNDDNDDDDDTIHSHVDYSFKSGDLRFMLVSQHAEFRFDAGAFCADKLNGRLAIIRSAEALQEVNTGLVVYLRKKAAGYNEIWVAGNTDTPAHGYINMTTYDWEKKGDQCLILSDWHGHEGNTRLFSKACHSVRRAFLCEIYDENNDKIDTTTTAMSPTTRIDAATIPQMSRTTRIDATTTHISPTTRIGVAVITVKPTDAIGLYQSSASFVCTVSGSLDSQHQLIWAKQTATDYLRIASNSESVNTDKYVITERYRLTIIKLVDSDEGTYICSMNNKMHKASLSVVTPPRQLTISWSEIDRRDHFTCRAYASRPHVSFRWQRNSVDLTSQATSQSPSYNASGYADTMSALPWNMSQSDVDVVYTCIADLPNFRDIRSANYTPSIQPPVLLAGTSVRNAIPTHVAAQCLAVVTAFNRI